MPIVEHAVIAAAGLGSRLGHGKPKCLVRVQGVSVLSHLMRLVADVPDVRVVVGFMEAEVIEELARIRPDAIVVRNPGFRVTTTLHSYAMGAQGLTGDCLFMDADIFVVPESFDRFVGDCRPGEARLALTPSRSTDAVYVELEDGFVTGFRRDRPTEYEWANISWLPVGLFEKIGHTAVYEHLRNHLPALRLGIGEVDSYEIDTAEDLEAARQKSALFRLDECPGYQPG
ncbi:MAG: NTP transferase domain-containing protein [Sphingobium sp.]